MPVTADVLLRGQLAYLREHGFDVSVISSPGPELDRVAQREGVRVIAVPIAREISPVADAQSLLRLTQVLRELKPDIVNASTAKAGLLGMVAARLTGVPHRVYQLRGLRLETEAGLKRSVLATTERIAAGCAHRIVCNSESLRARYVEAGYAPADRCVVLGAGSSNGIDVQRFARTDALVREARELRTRFGIPDTAPVIGFVGRPVADKGIPELLAAFERARVRFPDARLMILGAGFANDHPDAEIARRANVVVIDHVDEPAPYYAMMDVLAFPSHREGFPNVPLEAAAAGVPTVGSRATGVCDAVSDGVTGLLVDIGDEAGLADALVRYLGEPALRERHGHAARERAASQFAREVVWERWRDEYERLLSASRTRASDPQTQDPRLRG